MKIKILAAIATLALSSAGMAQDVVDVADYEAMQKDYNYRRAIDLYGTYKYDEAIGSLEKAIAENPNNARALFKLGEIYGRAYQDEANAKKNLRKAVELAGKDAKLKVMALAELANLYMNVGDVDLARQAAHEAAVICNKMSPKDCTGLVYLAFAYTIGEQPDYAAAASCYRRATEINPFNPFCWQQLCRCLVEIGTPESLKEAEQAMTDAQNVGISFDDSNLGMYIREKLALKKGDYAQCAKIAVDALSHYRSANGGGEVETHIAMLDSASAHNPVAVRLMLEDKMNADPLLAKWPEVQGRICRSREDYDNAIAAYRKAYDIDSSSVNYLYCIATSQIEKLDCEGTISTCNAIVARDTTYAQVYALRAVAYETLDRKAAAMADFDKAVSLDPTMAANYYRRAHFERYNGMLNEAMLDISTAIQLDSDYSLYYLTRANILKALGEKDVAKEDYQAVIDVTNGHIRLYNDWKNKGDGVVKKRKMKKATAEEYANRAYAHFYLGDSDAAIRDMDLSAEINPYKDVAYYNCACLYSLMGQTDKSVGYLRQAVDAGYYQDVHMNRDTDLDNIRGTEGYKACLADAKAHREAQAGTTSHLAKSAPADTNADQPDVVEVPFTRNGGVLVVSCTVNGLPLNYIFDSGAADVCISLSEAQFMLKNGYLDQKDLGGKEYFGDATGRVSEGMSINLKTLTFGGLTIRNVKASVTSTLNAPLLLGQTAMQKLGNVHIDYDKGVVRITKRAK